MDIRTIGATVVGRKGLELICAASLCGLWRRAEDGALRNMCGPSGRVFNHPEVKFPGRIVPSLGHSPGFVDCGPQGNEKIILGGIDFFHFSWEYIGLMNNIYTSFSSTPQNSIVKTPCLKWYQSSDLIMS